LSSGIRTSEKGLSNKVASVVQIEFIGVGRSKFSAIVDFKVPRANYYCDSYEIATLALSEARKHLMSSNVECIYNKQTNEGVINVGFHIVGHFRVVK